MPRFRKMQDLIDRLSLVTRENLSGMMVIRAFNTQKFEEERFDRANIDLTKTSLFVNRAMVILFPVMLLVMSGMAMTSHRVVKMKTLMPTPTKKTIASRGLMKPVVVISTSWLQKHILSRRLSTTMTS